MSLVKVFLMSHCLRMSLIDHVVYSSVSFSETGSFVHFFLLIPVQGKYKVYNLCSERLYDASLFEGKVCKTSTVFLFKQSSSYVLRYQTKCSWCSLAKNNLHRILQYYLYRFICLWITARFWLIAWYLKIVMSSDFGIFPLPCSFRWLVFHLMTTIALPFNSSLCFVKVLTHGWRKILKMLW